MGEVLADGDLWPSALEATALTVPSAFRSFDQHPRDMQALAHRVAEAHPDREQPVVVFGVRTSGSYLGPLLAEITTPLRPRGTDALMRDP